jgi:ABC-type transport system involved in multi-copper enzyme maturation permease subunit
MQPIIERELGVASRFTGTYRNRMLAPVFVAGLGIAKELLMSTPASPAMAGADLFHTLSFLTVGFCVLEGVRKTADCISQERREGTLGLLFLTDLKSRDIIFGKLVSASLTSFYALFAMLPILAWSLFLGGVTPGEIWRAGLAATSLLLFSLAAGIWVSARSRSASRAMLGTFCLMLVVMAAAKLPGAKWLATLSPACAFFYAPRPQYLAHAGGFWISLALAPGLIWLLLANAAAVITRFRDDDGVATNAANARLKKPGATRRRSKLRARLLELNPIGWLADRSRVSLVAVWMLVIIGCLGIAILPYQAPWAPGVGIAGSSFVSLTVPVDLILLLLVILINGFIKVLLAAQACRCLAEARRNATLELLLCAPLKVMDILQGQILAMRRTFLPPLLVLLAFESLGLFEVINGHYGIIANKSDRQEFVDAVFFAGAGFIFYVLIDFQAVAWAGMWFGLCSRNESRGTFKTIFYVIVVPHLLLILALPGICMLLAWPIATLVWARLKLQEQFRSLAGHRLTSSGDPNGWVPFEIPELPETEPLVIERTA